MELYYRKKRGGGVCLYMHDTLQYKVRDDLTLGNDPETVKANSFIRARLVQGII